MKIWQSIGISLFLHAIFFGIPSDGKNEPFKKPKEEAQYLIIETEHLLSRRSQSSDLEQEKKTDSPKVRHQPEKDFVRQNVLNPIEPATHEKAEPIEKAKPIIAQSPEKIVEKVTKPVQKKIRKPKKNRKKPKPIAKADPKPVREPEPVRKPEPVREPEPVKKTEPVKKPEPVREPTELSADASQTDVSSVTEITEKKELSPKGTGVKAKAADNSNDKPPNTLASAAPTLPKEPVSIGFDSANGPKFIHRIMPSYPFRARRFNKQGTVILEVTIDEKGNPFKIRILEKAGFGFDEAAVNAVKRSTFKPAKEYGKPITCKAILPIRFVLE